MRDVVRRRELAQFLRSRRERITPESIGLQFYGPRKTPGLRREEVADLAGLGLAWYTWLEQARPISVSEDVLCAIARALRLTDDERSHLLMLGRTNRTPRDVRDEERDVVGFEHLAVLTALDPNPAHIRDEHWNVLAWNRTFAALTGVATLPHDEQNLLWIIFTDQRAMELHADWGDATGFAVAQFRFECARRLQDPEVVELVERLHDVSPEFARLWNKHEVDSGIGSVVEWRHRNTGMVFERAVYPIESAFDPGLVHGPRRRMTVHVPKPETGTRELLEHLLATAS
jgi:transcriptional regulator with XRE-family HTH domain